MRHSAARASTAAVLVDSSAMSGFKEHIQGVRADVARRRNERRGEPPLEFRLRPVPTARRLWANAMGGRLGIGSDGNRVALVTEPKTGLKLPGESRGASKPAIRAVQPRELSSFPPIASVAFSLPAQRPRPFAPTTGEYCVNGGKCAPLTGMGVRIKRIAGIGVKVYACGLYVNPASARAAVGDRYVGKSVKDVAKDQTLFDVVNAAADVEKTVRLVFARDIDSAKIRDALSERLRPALGADSPSLRRFEAYFDGVTFKKGQSLTFTASGGKLITSFGSKEAGQIADGKLCTALFDAYLGKSPVVPSAKESLGEQLAGHVTG